jgi:hypothetical protein
MKRFAVVAAWIAGTVLSGAVAWAMVGLAGERVGDEAVAPLSVKQVEDLAAGLSTTSTPAGPTTATTNAGAASVPASSTTTVAASTPPSTVAPTTVAGPVTEAHRVPGGIVVIRYTATWIELASATPEQGFGVEVKSSGPERIEVEFDGNEVEVRFRAELIDGGVVIDVTEGE